MHDSPARKPDWLENKRLLSLIHYMLNIPINIININNI